MSDLSSNPRIGIIGSGFIINDCHLPAYRKQGFNPAAIASRTKAHAEKVAATHNIATVHDSIDNLLDNPTIEVLDIAVPPQTSRPRLRRSPFGCPSLRGRRHHPRREPKHALRPFRR